MKPICNENPAKNLHLSLCCNRFAYLHARRSRTCNGQGSFSDDWGRLRYLGTELSYRIKPDADGTPVRVPAGEANLKWGGIWPLLIFFQNPRNPDQFRIQVTPDDLVNFPAGSYKFMNYSNQAVKANVGSDSLSLISQQTGLLKGHIDPQKRTNFTQICSDMGGNSKLLYSNNWAINPTLRTMVFINQSAEPGSPITVKRLTDYIEIFSEPRK